jgi:hypothetical protein
MYLAGGRKAHCNWKRETIIVPGSEKGSLYLEGRSLNLTGRRRLNTIEREKGSLYLEERRLNVPATGKRLNVPGKRRLNILGREKTQCTWKGK